MQTMPEEWSELVRLVPLHDGCQIERAIILRILQRRFHPNKESLQNLAHQLSPITDNEDFLQLVDLGLEVMTLPDFQSRLQKMLSTSH